jgi:hypothetical protein
MIQEASIKIVQSNLKKSRHCKFNNVQHKSLRKVIKIPSCGSLSLHRFFNFYENETKRYDITQFSLKFHHPISKNVSKLNSKFALILISVNKKR